MTITIMLQQTLNSYTTRTTKTMYTYINKEDC